MLKYIGFAALMTLLAGCSSTTYIPDTYSTWGHPATLVKSPNFPEQGFYYTRTAGDTWVPNTPWTGTSVADGDTFILDFGLELKQTADGNYYRVHMYPIKESILPRVAPWIKVIVNRNDDDSDPMLLFAKLPTPEARSATGPITTDWFICDACTAGKTSRFDAMTITPRNSTDRNWYKFVASPGQTPNWSGDMQQREAQFQQERDAKAQQLAALEASMPPSVLRDKYMVQLSQHLKQQNFGAALPLFRKLEALPIATDPSLDYFYGEALLKTDQPGDALQKLYRYINTQGAQGAHYTRALELINQAESKL